MRISSNELRAESHPDWRLNPIIQQYLGSPATWQERADGLAALLQERPLDYVQVLMLRVFNGDNLQGTLQDLQHAAALPPAIKDIIFADEAAFMTVYDTTAFTKNSRVPALADLLGDTVDAQTQEEIIAGLELRLRVSEAELRRVTGERDAARQEVGDLKEQIATLTFENVRLRNRLAQHESAPAGDDQLMIQYGIHPGISEDMLSVVVRALRRHYARELHSDRNGPEAGKQLSEVNDDLNRILKSKGLGNAQG